MNKLNLKIITPEKLAYESVIDEFYAPTQMGKIGILPRHIPLVAALKPGEMVIRKNGVDFPVAVSGGILEVKPIEPGADTSLTPVVVLADHLEFAHEIDVQRSREAHDRAQKAMQEKGNVIDVEFAMLQSKIEKELNRVKIGSKYKK